MVAMDFDNSLAIYSQLAREWRRLIASQIWPAGSKVESVRDLATRYGVNPNTVQRALAELEREGLAQSRRTLGRFVTEDEDLIKQTKEVLAIEAIDRFVQDVKNLDLSNDFLMERLSIAMREKDIDERSGSYE